MQLFEVNTFIADTSTYCNSLSVWPLEKHHTQFIPSGKAPCRLRVLVIDVLSCDDMVVSAAESGG